MNNNNNNNDEILNKKIKNGNKSNNNWDKWKWIELFLQNEKQDNNKLT